MPTRPSRRRHIAAVSISITVSSLLASAAIAQRSQSAPAKAPAKKPAASCTKPDTAAAWYVKQRQTLTESGLTWSNDSLRRGLLDAANLTPDQALAPQLGWQITAAMPATPSPAESLVIATLKRRGGRGGGRGPRPADTASGAATAPPAAGTRPPRLTGPAGWPFKSVVGVAGIRAVYLLIQRDSALQEAGKHQMMEAGPDESLAADVAVLEDRSRLIIGRKQVYGTQFKVVAGRVVPYPMEDSAHVDIRRDDAGLPPFRWSACNAAASLKTASPRSPAR